jgi:putative tricarboxylic transport membrane protein
MYIGNVALLILNLPLVGLWVSLLRVPQSILMALILLLIYVGAYSINNSMFDLLVLTGMGVIGYLFRKVKFDASPLVVALILGPMLETSLTESLSIGRGNPLVFFQRPISGSLLGILVLVLVSPLIWRVLTKSRQRRAGSVSSGEH